MIRRVLSVVWNETLPWNQSLNSVSRLNLQCLLRSDLISSGVTSMPRFDLFVKAGADGSCFGDCPFSQRVYMVMLLKTPKDSFSLHFVDISNKTPEFLRINPGGKVPVLVDQETGEVVDDSGKIVEYISSQFPCEDLQCNYSGPAADAASGVFPKLAAYLKNQDLSKSASLREALCEELSRLNGYLSCDDCKGKRFLLSDKLTDLDCSILPKLNHVCVAAGEYKNFTIPQELTALQEYMNIACEENVWKATKPADQEIIHGWSRHGVIKES